MKNFAASHFEIFLPEFKTQYEQLGAVYDIIALPEDLKHGPTFSANRYYPQRLAEDADIMIHQLLTAFHRHPFVLTRFAPQGTVACIRAYDKEYVEVVFR